MPKSTILLGDVRKRLAEIPDGSVRTVITSPPYFGLRDYGTASWEGGDDNCEHTISANDADGKAVFAERVTRGDRTACLKCGAARIDAQIGLEETPDAYVAEMVDLFRDVRRVLADDGTLWLNLGDSYAGGGGGNYNKTGVSQAGGQHIANVRNRPKWLENAGVKPKDLIGIPWRVALALQQDGWYLRSDIIWHKPNPMPESVTDRPTKSHEYVFLLSKSPKYFYDHEAIKEDGVVPAGTKYAKGSEERAAQTKVNARPPEYKIAEGKRNKRDVWSINTKPFKGAHFAVMPEALVEPCVLAGTSEKGKCSECGSPLVRITHRGERPSVDRSETNKYPETIAPNRKVGGQYQKWLDENPTKTLGWQPTCDCGAEVVPDTVLDPFTGSGTVAVVANRHGRNFIGTELNPDYAEIAKERITESAPMFNEVEIR